ncbi:MAG: sigma 54-interacting transcriptional regulator [Anaeromyxobacter sp.]
MALTGAHRRRSPLSAPLPSPAASPFLGFGSEEALRATAAALPEGLFTTDLDGRVTHWNAAAERITGWSPAEAIGRTCSLLSGDVINGCACGAGPLRCALAATGRSSKTCTIRTKDGRLLLIVKNAVRLLAPGGETVGALETFTPVGPAGQEAGTGCDPALPAPGALVGRHPTVRELQRVIGLVARSSATVLVVGESGVGKELVAEAIHAASPRAERPLVRVRCAALGEVQLERELFGAAGGAEGELVRARGGTLLLDEIGDLPARVQAKLLRVLEAREVLRPGDERARPVDVRLVCTTHRELRAQVDAGVFRADLYFRLAAFPVHVPALRDRVEDLPLLVGAFLRAEEPARPHVRRVRPAALAALAAYRWPGNVRELHNVLAYAMLQAGDGELDVPHLPGHVRTRRPLPRPRPAAPVDEEAGRLRALLDACGWNRAEAARRLGISRVTLWKRLKAARIGPPPPPGPARRRS